MKFKPLPHSLFFLAKAPVVILLFFVALMGTTKMNAMDNSLSQKPLSIQADQESLKDVLKKIQDAMEITFIYKTDDIDLEQKVSIKVENLSLKEVLDKLLTPLSLQFTIHENSVILKKQEATSTEKIISGKVTTSDTQEPLPGVNILVKGTTKGTSTDANGSYSLSVDDEEATLIFSFIGYTQQEIKIGAAITVDVVLEPDAKQLQEVVVVGYGTLKRSEVVGAVSQVPLKESGSRNYNTAAELLQGTVAGVTVMNNGGDPTASPNINIRGIGSINAESPMIVLDGVIYAGSLNTINPEDIGSISVLKDAASAAIYGSRASGGVILITTKKGITEKMNLSVNYQQGFQEVGKKLKALDAADYADAMNTATDNAGLPRIPAFNVNIEPTARTTNTVWMDQIFRTGKVHNLAVSLSGGSKRSTFFLSGGYRKNEGILLNTYSDRYTVRLNSSHQLLPNVRIGENLTYSLTNGQTANTTSGYTGAIITSIFYPPNATIYRQDGSGAYGGVPTQFPGSYGDVINPVAYLNRLDNKNPISTLLINPYIEWDIIEGLKFRSNWGITQVSNNYTEFQTKITEPGKIFDFNSLTKNSSSTLDLLSEQTLSYEKMFGSDHDFKVMAGYTYQKTKEEYSNIYATGFDNEDPAQRYIVNASLVEQKGAGTYESYLVSYLGRASYAYKGKYMISGVVRRDGTSKLLSNNRWAVYPSVSLGWLVSDENFMKALPFITNLKLRASYGQIGNLGNLRPYQFSVPLTKTSSTLLGQTPGIKFGYSERELSNSGLQWERSSQENVGLDFGLFNKLTGTIDAFSKTNKQMLFQESLPAGAGVPDGRTINAGNVKNKGIELGLTYKKETGAIKYDATINYAIIKNEVTALNEGIDLLFNASATTVRALPVANVYKVGSPINAFYGYQTDGIFQSNEEAIGYVNSKGVRLQSSATAGDFRFKDSNNDGVIDDKDRVVLGNPFPTNTFSFNGNVQYKGFDLNVFLQGVSGNKIFNAVKYTGVNPSVTVGYNLLEESKNAWTPENGSNTIPKLSAKDPNNNFGRISDFYLEDASFLRLRNLTVGYTLPEKVLKNKASLRLYLTGQNLFTITNYSGMDPEIGLNNSGYDLGRYPLSKIYMAGIQFGF